MEEKRRVYVETTIPSVLTAWPKTDPILHAQQLITQNWWQNERVYFDLFISQFVIGECERGDQIAATDRLKSLESTPLLEITDEAKLLSREIVKEVRLPQKAESDALHIAIAAIHGMNHLLTWNCRHLANSVFRPRVVKCCDRFGLEAPDICTPEELMVNLP